MNYAVVRGSIFAVHVLAMISPGPNVLIVIPTGHQPYPPGRYCQRRWVLLQIPPSGQMPLF
jgi:hypothetical protein